jgi:capsular exopolysaccharide synthesis family protein
MALTSARAATPMAPQRGDHGPLEDAHQSFGWRDGLAAVQHYKWLVLGTVLLGMVAALVVIRRLPRTYRAQAVVWVDALDRRSRDQAAIRAGQLLGLGSSAWVQLLRSATVLQDVVEERRSYLRASPKHDDILTAFRATPDARPGRYRLVVSRDSNTYTLSNDDDVVLESGTIGDSIGRGLGFLWAPAADAVTARRTVEFAIISRANAVASLGERIQAQADSDGTFLRIRLRGSSPGELAGTVNAVATRFVSVAADLRRQKLREVARILGEQLQQAESGLQAAATELRDYQARVPTVIPERTASATDPNWAALLAVTAELEQVRRDRAAIVRQLESTADGATRVAALEAIGAVQRSTELTQALRELVTKHAELRALRYHYTEEHPLVRRLASEVETLARVTAPTMARELVADLSAREIELAARVNASTTQVRQVPYLMMELVSRQRNLATAEQLYLTVRQRYEEARLAEVSSVPEVRVLDRAVEPESPLANAGASLLFVSLVGSLGLGVLGAMLLDRRHPRVRFPEHVTRQMGLRILGVVPHMNGGDDDEITQALEAMRGLRLSVEHAYGAAGPIVFTVTSPAISDGKSFVAANLALAFAESGRRVLLMDADVRRGSLHRVLNLPRKPGLTDLLESGAPALDGIQSTRDPRLEFLACGRRIEAGPALLGSAGMERLLAAVRARYEVIIVDTPPLCAGADPFVMGTLTANLLVVLRTGRTDRALAEAKLDMLDYLPVRVLGAVLNDVRAGGLYRYYGYDAVSYSVEVRKGEDPRRLVFPQVQ